MTVECSKLDDGGALHHIQVVYHSTFGLFIIILQNNVYYKTVLMVIIKIIKKEENSCAD